MNDNDTIYFFDKDGNLRVINQELNNKSVEMAKSMVAKAAKEEPKVTKDLIDITKGTQATISYAQKDDDGNLRNSLEFKLKGQESLANKLREECNYTVDELGKTPVYDVLRYTALVGSDDAFVRSYTSIMQNLESRGYDIMRVRNTMNDYNEDKPYRGINTVIKTPTGYNFELQFHTPKSLEIKEINHVLYKKQSRKNTDEENQKIADEMYRNSTKFKNIPNAGTIKSFDKFKEGKR